MRDRRWREARRPRAAFRSNSSRRPWTLTRPKALVTVVSAPTTSISPARRTSCSAQALSLPLDQAISALGRRTIIGVRLLRRPGFARERPWLRPWAPLWRAARRAPAVAGSGSAFGVRLGQAGQPPHHSVGCTLAGFPGAADRAPHASRAPPRRRRTRDRGSAPSSPCAPIARRATAIENAPSVHGSAFHCVVWVRLTARFTLGAEHAGQPFDRETDHRQLRPAPQDRGRIGRRPRSSPAMCPKRWRAAPRCAVPDDFSNTTSSRCSPSGLPGISSAM